MLEAGLGHEGLVELLSRTGLKKSTALTSSSASDADADQGPTVMVEGSPAGLQGTPADTHSLPSKQQASLATKQGFPLGAQSSGVPIADGFVDQTCVAPSASPAGVSTGCLQSLLDFRAGSLSDDLGYCHGWLPSILAL